MTQGIRTRLLLAFSWIGLFAVLAAGAAVYALLEVNRAMERITARRVPSALASLELSRQAERVVAAAPKLLTVNDSERYGAITGSIQQQVADMHASVAALSQAGIDASETEVLQHSVDLLGANLFSLDDVVASKIIAFERNRVQLNDLSKVHIAFQRFLTPQVALMEAKAQRLRNLQQEGSTDYAELAALAADIAERLPMQNILLDVSTIDDTLHQAAAEHKSANLAVLSFPLLRALKRLETAVLTLPENLREPLSELTGKLKPFVEGNRSVPELRRRELSIQANGVRLLQINTTLSGEFTRAMNQLVDAAKADIDLATKDAARVQQFSTNFLFAMVALILLSSVLIVVLYVDRSLLRRLRQISDSMRAIAAGNLSTPVPVTGRDEIGQMAAALEVFRHTAIEVEASNLREIESARSRLTDAIESISDGFALFDAQDRLVVANSRYLQMLGLDGSRSDYTFEMILDQTLSRKLLANLGDDAKAWREQRLARHRQPSGSDVLQLAEDNRWIRVNERRTEEGNTVGVYADITELKQRELELAHAMRAKDHTLAELTIVLEAIDYGVLLLDADLRIRVSNRKYRQIWNMPETFFARHPTLQEDMEYTRANGRYLARLHRCTL
jgi:PAS domain-containing protein